MKKDKDSIGKVIPFKKKLTWADMVVQVADAIGMESEDLAMAILNEQESTDSLQIREARLASIMRVALGRAMMRGKIRL